MTTLALVAMIAALLPAFVVAASPVLATGPVFINEIHYDNDGADAGEFVEIAGPAGTDLTGWTVALYNGSATQLNVYSTINLSGTIPDEGAGFGALSFSQTGIQNGSPDGLALVDNTSTVIEFLSYEGSFTAASGPAAGMASSDIGVSEPGTTLTGESLQLTGTGTVAADFSWTGPVAESPGLLNTGQVFGSAPAVTPGDLVINEVDYDQAGTDNAEYVEIKNVTGAAIDLTDVTLVFASGAAASIYDTIDLTGTTLAAGDYYVVCGDAANVVNCDLDDGPDTNFIQNGAPDAMAIYFDGTVIDALSYEGDAAAPFIEGSGFLLADDGDDALTGLSRCADGTDTDQNNVDFVDARPITPGATNDCPAGPSAADVLINETDADTPGTDALEFVEIFDGGAGNTALDGLVVVFYNGNGDTSYRAFDLDGFSTNGDGYFLLGNSAVSPTPDIIFGSNGLQNGADAVAVYAADADDFPNGTPVTTTNLKDAVVYDTNDGDDAGLLVLLNAGQPQVNEGGAGDKDNDSNQRCLNGSGGPRNTDTFAQNSPTPGAENFCPSPFELVINEIIQNPSAVFDSNGEWFELYNPTGAAIDIDGWTVRDDGSNSHTISNGGPLSVPAGGFLVLGVNADFGTNGGVVVDYEYSGFFLGNSDDEVIVEDSLGLEVDRVEYDGGPAFPDPNGASMSLKLPVADNNVGVSWCTASTPFGDGDSGTPGAANDCPPTRIHEVQGAGLVSPLVGGTVLIEGIVVGDFQDDVGVNGDLNGFFVQEEDADADGNAMTSEGIFVFQGSNPAVDVAIGDKVRVEGVVSEFFDSTQITSISGVTVESSGNPLPTATELTLPVTSVDDFEAFEGMYVTFPQALVISEYFNFDRFGEIVLTKERYTNPTSEFEPGSVDAADAAQDYLLNRITLDDGRTSQNPDPSIHPNGLEFDLTNLFRGGDTVANVTGVINYSFDLYRVQPTQGADYTSVNERTDAPDDVGGRINVATLNVLNYFTTLDTIPGGFNGPYICGPNEDLECRGANDADELIRQRDKIVAALAAIDADIVGLIEIENNIGDGPTADLVAGLNAVVGAGMYDYVATGAIGTDAIRQAIIYKPATVSPVGAFAVLDSSVDDGFNDDKNRPALAQTFHENVSGAAFTVAINHLKSKGSPCDDVGDPNLDDGAGNCNLTRKAAAEALVDWLATDPTGSGDEDFLIIGDLNSYDKEDPIDVLRAGGYTDLVDDYLGEHAYSYVFDGRTGYLDYQMANGSMASQVTGTTIWHINADEADLIDYDTSFKKDAQDGIYAPDPYRASDHDPVIVGLDLDAPFDFKVQAAEGLAVLLPTGDSGNDKRIEKAIERIEDSLNPAWWESVATLEEKKGKRVFDREKQAVKELMKVDAPDGAAAQVAIDLLVEADRWLGQFAIDAAVAAGGDQYRIDKALDRMVQAGDAYADGRPDKAVGYYKKAWQEAIKALD